MKLSIITINYNNRDGLQKTVDSVVSQTYKNFEWIIIDGGSTDGSKELIEQYQDHCAYWCSEPDKGIYNAMNKGVEKATGEYCLFLNSGDRLHDDTVVDKIVKEFDGMDFISGDEWWVNENYQMIKKNENPDFVTKYHMLVGILWHQCTFIKTSLLKEHPYDESLKIAADWEEMFYEFLINNRTYKHCRIIVSDFVVGGMSERNWALLCSERKMIRDKYLSQKEQDLISIEHHFQKRDSIAIRQMGEIAYTAFVNQYYSQLEYVNLFLPYRQEIIQGCTWYQRCFVKLCLTGKMQPAMFLYHFVRSLICKKV